MPSLGERPEISMNTGLRDSKVLEDAMLNDPDTN